MVDGDAADDLVLHAFGCGDLLNGQSATSSFDPALLPLVGHLEHEVGDTQTLCGAREGAVVAGGSPDGFNVNACAACDERGRLASTASCQPVERWVRGHNGIVAPTVDFTVHPGTVSRSSPPRTAPAALE
ncbi:hypothetical protein [Phycicoccus avicenniae]|uniref:hypothetical protein n=1 Tax=Phycicoccus avicenniae TaxID=2828860 RepID=UPI003D27EE5A